MTGSLVPIYPHGADPSIRNGTENRATIYAKEVVREVLACGAEQILCVRSDPRGDHEPTSYDIEDARRLKNALWLIDVPLVDYIVVGESVTSLCSGESSDEWECRE